MKNCYVLYCRKSSESEDKQMASIQSQLDVLNDLIKKQNLNVTATFTESKSAKAPGRIEFNKMIDLIKKSDNIKGIIAWDISRLARNPIDEGVVRWLLDSGKIEEVVTPFKTYCPQDSSLLMAIEGGKAQSFIQDLKRNTKRGVDKKIDMGMFPGTAPVGYINNKDKLQGAKDISPHPRYFNLMREIFRLALTGKYSSKDLRDMSEKMGIKNSRDRFMERSQIYRYLRNPFYCGMFMYAGKLYQGSHKPMISKTEFNALQEILDGKANVWKQIHNFPFKGFVKCGHCGYQIVGETHTKKSGLVFDYYTCSMKKRGKCSQCFIPADELETQVSEFLEKIKVSGKFIDWAAKWLKKAEERDRGIRNSTFETISIDHKETEQKLSTLTDKWLMGMLTDDEYREHKQRYTQQLHDLDEKLKTTDQKWEEWTDLTLKILEFARTAQDKWNNGTIEEKQRVLIVTGSNLVLKDKKLMFTAKTPFMMINKANSLTNSKYLSSNQFLEADLGTDYTLPVASGVGDET